MLWKPLWIHEDDYNRTEFMPLGCWNFCRDELDKIDAHDEAHRVPEGIGWTKMYSIQPSPQPLVDIRLKVSDLSAAMPWRLRKTKRVLSGMLSEEGSRLPRTAAYMAGGNAIVFSWSDDKIINDLWFHDVFVSGWQRGPLLEAFFRIGILSPMLLVDWRGALVDLSDRKAIGDYLSAPGPVGSKSDGSVSVGGNSSTSRAGGTGETEQEE